MSSPTSATCTNCPAPARWRDGNGLTFCGSHVPTNGKPITRMQAPPETDIVERLEALADTEPDAGPALIAHAAADEIRRLRALVPSDRRQPGV
jgi:hypothetical protein